MNTRLSFRLASFGWGFMPTHLVGPFLSSSSLCRLRIAGGNPFHIRLHSVRIRGRAPGIAARWATEHLRDALTEAKPDA